MYIADSFNNKIRFLKNGVVSTIIGANGYGDIDGDASIAKINNPLSLSLNKKGELFISCTARDNFESKLKRMIID
jgi:hypothetical protein